MTGKKTQWPRAVPGFGRPIVGIKVIDIPRYLPALASDIPRELRQPSKRRLPKHKARDTHDARQWS